MTAWQTKSLSRTRDVRPGRPARLPRARPAGRGEPGGAAAGATRRPAAAGRHRRCAGRRHRRLAAGHGPVAVDAERASGFRYGHRAFLVQLRRRRRGHGAHRPRRLPRPVRPRRRAGRRGGRHPRRVPGPAVPGRPRLPAAAAVRHRAGRTAARLPAGRARHRWSSRCSGWPWRRATPRPTGPPGRCPRSGCATPPSTSRCSWSCATPWPPQLAEQGKAEWARQEFAAVLSAEPAAAAPGPVAPHLRHSPGPQPARPGHRPRALAGARPDRAAA